MGKLLLLPFFLCGESLFSPDGFFIYQFLQPISHGVFRDSYAIGEGLNRHIFTFSALVRAVKYQGIVGEYSFPVWSDRLEKCALNPDERECADVPDADRWP